MCTHSLRRTDTYSQGKEKSTVTESSPNCCSSLLSILSVLVFFTPPLARRPTDPSRRVDSACCRNTLRGVSLSCSVGHSFSRLDNLCAADLFFFSFFLHTLSSCSCRCKNLPIWPL